MQADEIKRILKSHDLMEQLGKGSQGVVYKLKSIANGNMSCVKILDLNNSINAKHAELEVRLTMQLRHPNIILSYSAR